MEFARSGPSGVDDEILRREIEAQRELCRLQVLDEKLPESQRPIRAKKKGGVK